MESQGNWKQPNREDWKQQRDDWRKQREAWRHQRRNWRCDYDRRCARRRCGGRRVFGLVVFLIGAVLLLQLVFPGFAGSVFGWPLALIIIGLLVGFRSGFSHPGWLVLMLIGFAYMFPFTLPNGISSTKAVWPALLVVVGASIIFSRHPHPRFGPKRMGDLGSGKPGDTTTTNGPDVDTIRVDAMFGGRKEVVTSRNFKGGTVRVQFSGVELNLNGAEGGEEPMVLDINVSFGGLELIIPSHWDLQNEIQPVLGSIEDQRSMRTTNTGTAPKLLILRGSCSFGSIEIKSF